MQVIAKWTDEQGQNTLNGTTTTNPLELVSFSGYGIVSIPADANCYRPHRPVMVFVGKASDVLTGGERPCDVCGLPLNAAKGDVFLTDDGGTLCNDHYADARS